MRDVVWTIILVWLVWRIYNAFIQVSQKKSKASDFTSRQGYSNKRNEGEVKIENIDATKQKSHFKPEDGEYVDYEEIK